ncbi:MAG: pilus assembly protein PilM [Cellulosilyticaceae bacterium]
MMKKMLGIELSDGWIKIVELKEKRKKWEVKAAVKLETPCQAIVEGELVGQDTVYRLIKEQLGQMGVRSKKVCVRISSKQILTKYMPLQANSVKEAKRMIKDKKDLYFPVEGDYVIDAAITGEKRGQELGALMVAAPSRVIRPVIGLMDQLGLKVAAISIPSYGYCKVCGSETAIVVEVGEAMSLLSCIDQGSCKAVQQVSFGMRDVERALVSEFGAGETGDVSRFYEKYMMLYPETEPENKEFVSHYVSAVVTATMEEQLVNEIQKMMLFYEGEVRGSHVDRIYVTGDCSSIKGLTAYLEGQIGVPVAYLVPDVHFESRSLRSVKQDLPAFANILCLTTAMA